MRFNRHNNKIYLFLTNLHNIRAVAKINLLFTPLLLRALYVNDFKHTSSYNNNKINEKGT